MAEPQQKRLREESHQEFEDINSNSKRQKPYNNILSLLDDEEEEPIEDLSAMFTTLEQELSSSATTFDFESPAEDDAHHQKTVAEDDDAVNSVIRHLLEASDDELGIPNTDNYNHEIKSDEIFPFGFVDNGLWELEDVAANYYTILQSELFLEVGGI